MGIQKLSLLLALSKIITDALERFSYGKTDSALYLGYSLFYFFAGLLDAFFGNYRNFRGFAFDI